MTQKDFAISRFQDGAFVIDMAPPTAIGGWTIQFVVHKHFGSLSGLIIKSVGSGMNNQSGINITNSGAGVMNISINAGDTSGMDYGNYSYRVERLNSGMATPLTLGFMKLLPG